MARRPTNEMVEISTRVPRGHDGYWQILLELDAAGVWGIPDVDARTNADRGSVKDFVLRLARGGIARRAGARAAKDGRSQVKLYRLNERPVETPRLDRQGNRRREPTIETLWRTMKMVKTFTVADLAELTERNTVSGRMVIQRYLRHLLRCGVIAPAGKSGPAPVYRLVRDLGARAPLVLKTLSLYDPNEQVVLGAGETTEAQP